ncbi:HD domain-containing phosphohydrolase [Rugamonas sp.]|uniref:HD-GYP domain-containing protein n=1 Tax=Rugamonas sp. TaxID=1926287 RepID=UPI0025ED16A3|nr:HD domain-containing phosphohydrolase [Rugamonas sp.]
MEIRKVTPADVRLGMLIPWDVHGDNGRLLARKGYLISSPSQIAALIERGIYQDDSIEADSKEPPSVLRKLNAAQLELQLLLSAIANANATRDTRRRLDEVVRLVVEAAELDADVAIACILHNQTAAYAVRHSVDTAVVAYLIARSLDVPAAMLRSICLAALTMNVGMFDQHERSHASRLPLSAADRAHIRQHPYASVALLRRAGVDDEHSLDCVLAHHENDDGSGYPAGRSGADIPLGAKLIALADRYCAQVSARVFRAPLRPNLALREILLQAGVTVDAQLGAGLIRELGIYPVGTCVQLSNGEIGIVARKGLSSTTPYVDSVVGPRGAPLDVYLRRKTGTLHTIRNVLAANPSPAPLRMELIWGRAASP